MNEDWHTENRRAQQIPGLVTLLRHCTDGRGCHLPLQDSLALGLIGNGGQFPVPSLMTRATRINLLFLELIKNQSTEKNEKDLFPVKQDNQLE